MVFAIVVLGACGFLISLLATAAMKRVALRLNFVDKPGHRKIHHQPKPLGGGVAIFLAVALPMAGGLIAAKLMPGGLGGSSLVGRVLGQIELHRAGILHEAPRAGALLAAMLIMHLMGLRDDRKAMGPYVKLFVQLAVTTALVIVADLRVLTALDERLHAGGVLSVAVSVLWITAITNAFNFLDNMDGLSAGVAAVCTTAFLITTLLIGQWFIATALALLLGALVGFLVFNFHPASIFMGDSGSLVVGLVLGAMTARTTYLPPDADLTKNWYALLAPLLVVAVPLYDLVVVSIIRISRGKSPFVGDTNHLSHRLVARGMSRRTAVLCIWLMTAATSAGAILLPHVQSRFAAGVILGQTMLILGLVALLEQHPLPAVQRAEPDPLIRTERE